MLCCLATTVNLLWLKPLTTQHFLHKRSNSVAAAYQPYSYVCLSEEEALSLGRRPLWLVTQPGDTAKLPFHRLCASCQWSKLSVPQFPHLYLKNINAPRLWNRWWVLNKVMWQNGIASLAHSKYSIYNCGKGAPLFSPSYLWHFNGRGQEFEEQKGPDIL